MKFADKMKKIKPSATLAINTKALELKAQGIAITSLALGEPDFPTPQHICNAAKKAIDENFTKYTPVNSVMDARKAVCHYFQRQYQVTVNPENVILTTGGKQSLINTLFAMLNDGDDVLLPCPYWTSYPDMIRLAGANPILVKSDASRGFRITTTDLEKTATDNTRMLILNTPSNPTGTAYSQEEIDALVKWCIDHDIFVLADEIYDQLVYDGKPASASRWWEQYPEKLAIINGLSKAFSMTGWRIGYTVAHEELIRQCSKLQGQMTSHICSVSQKAAIAALDGPYDCVENMRQAFLHRRDMAMEEISTWPGVICHCPGGAFYLFPDVHALFTPELPTSEALCSYLLEKAHVACVPGEAFGEPNCIRISYAVSDENLMDALHRIKDALYH